MRVLALASRDKVFPAGDYRAKCPVCSRSYIVREDNWSRDTLNQSICQMCTHLNKRSKVKSPVGRFFPCEWAEAKPVFPKNRQKVRVTVYI